MTLKYLKPIPIQLKSHPHYDEKWVQERIAEDPAILGLGDLILKDVERMQPKAGRLDLLLYEPESGDRYEVELMLGPVDESHIIRTLEYWDIERKRYPQYEHCAVIVAEEITARFLNVIGLFNGFIPLIAIQLNALQVGDQIILNFTKVLDELILGTDEDDEDAGSPATDRAYWEAKSSKAGIALVDQYLDILHSIQPDLALGYRKGYIGLVENGKSNNFVIFFPKKKYVRASVRILKDQDAWRAKLDEAGVTVLERKNPRRILMHLERDDIEQQHDLLKELFDAAYQESLD